MILGLNHITLAVSELERSLDFYIDILGFKGHVKWESGAYLSIGNLWLCLSLDDVSPRSDYTHIAFDIDASHFAQFYQSIKYAGITEWKTNKSEGQSIYLLDPDGHKLEVHVGSLETRLTNLIASPYKGLVWLCDE